MIPKINRGVQLGDSANKKCNVLNVLYDLNEKCNISVHRNFHYL